ncbi:hypothetical protein EV426DRAFT_680931 [Tirmania nivea]|nr:hypothetical protein EV426DRAFT_680931 [Tirmania nivea]
MVCALRPHKLPCKAISESLSACALRIGFEELGLRGELTFLDRSSRVPGNSSTTSMGEKRGETEPWYEEVLVPVEKAIKLINGGGNRAESGLVFAADEQKILSRRYVNGRSWLVWAKYRRKRSLGMRKMKDKNAPSRESDNVEDGRRMCGSWDLLRRETFHIDKNTAECLAKEGKGRVVPYPTNINDHGPDDGAVQARPRG